MRGWTRRLMGVGAFAVVLLLVSAAESQEAATKQAAARAYNAAAALQNNGLYSQAAARWQEFIAKFPKDDRLDRASYYRGVCLLRTGKFPDAAAAFDEVLKRWPKFKDADGAQYNRGMAMYELALASNKAEDYRKAAAALSEVGKKFPKSRHLDRALYFQGDALFTANDLQPAATAFNDLITKFPASPQVPRARYDLGIVQQELGQHEQAAATFRAFLNDPKLARNELAEEVRLRAGLCLFGLKKYSESAKDFEAIAKLPQSSFADFATLRWGQCLVELDKTEEAAAILAQLPKKFPKSEYASAARLAAGRCYYSMNKLAEAEQQLRVVAGQNDERAAEANYWLGRTLLKKKQPQQALATLDNAVKRFQQGEFAVYLQLARIDALYDLPDRRKESSSLYEQFAGQKAGHPLGPQALYMAGRSALDLEDFPRAKQLSERFVNDPKLAKHELFPSALFVAAESTLLGEGAKEATASANAEKLYRRLVAEFPKHSRAPRSQLRIGWCLQGAGKHEDAAKHLRDGLDQLQEAGQLAEARWLIGRSEAALKRHSQAVNEFAEAMKQAADWPRRDEILLAWAGSLRSLGQTDPAAQRLQQLLKEHPQSELQDQALYELGDLSAERERHDEAISYYERVLQAPESSELHAAARYGLAASCFAKSDWTRTVAELERLLAKNPPADLAMRGRFLRGLGYQQQDEHDKAAADLTAFVAGKPDADSLGDARCALALSQLKLKQFDQAAAQVNQLLTEQPKFPKVDVVLYETGHALRDADMPAAALEAFQRLTTTRPDSPLVAEAWFHVGNGYQQQASLEGVKDAPKKWAAAEQALRTGLAKSKPGALREKLQYKLGDVLFRQDKFAEATETLRTQIKEAPDGELAGAGRFLAAESLFRQDAFAEALPMYETAADAKLKDFHARSLYRAGQCAAKLKNWPVSDKHFSLLLKSFPDFPRYDDALYGKGVALQQQTKVDEALQAYEQVTERTDAEVAAKARFMIGEIKFAKKQFNAAVEDFLEVAVGYPYPEWQALARFEAGRCLRELGKKEQAISMFRKLIATHPEHPSAKNAEKQIADLSQD